METIEEECDDDRGGEGIEWEEIENSENEDHENYEYHYDVDEVPNNTNGLIENIQTKKKKWFGYAKMLLGI